MAPPKSEFDQEMSQLEAEIKRLEAEYNMFFAGRLPRLPWETRARVDALVKRYDRMSIRNTAARFRFSTLQARYAGFCELWERALKVKEEGRPTRGRRAAPTRAAPDAAAGAAAKKHASSEPVARVVAVAAFKDPAAEADRMKELHERLCAARKEAGERPVPYEAFSQVVRAQMAKLGPQGTEVAFRVAVQDGKVTLTAKALKGAD